MMLKKEHRVNETKKDTMATVDSSQNFLFSQEFFILIICVQMVTWKHRATVKLSESRGGRNPTVKE